MTVINKNLGGDESSKALNEAGYPLIHKGKVRASHRLDSDSRIVVATDEVSSNDFKLRILIPGKGAILTALTHYWLTRVDLGMPNHLVQLDNDPGLNKIITLGSTTPGLDLTRSLVVKELKMFDFELIKRALIGGSVYKKYLETGIAGGHALEKGLPKWSKLKNPIATPSTKAKTGHDINITLQEFLDATGEMGKIAINQTLEAYRRAFVFAAKRGIIIADTKFEVGFNIHGVICLGDEVLTPDSSRFLEEQNWNLAMQKGIEPDFMDKQILRNYLANLVTPFGVTGIGNLDPLNPNHVAYVQGLKIPDEIIEAMINAYNEIFQRMTGMTLLAYQTAIMEI